MNIGADILVFSGSLNTLPDEGFCQTLRRAWEAARVAVVFNFLDSAALSAAKYLHWRRRGDVVAFARTLADGRILTLHDYLDGDYTIEMHHNLTSTL